MAAKSRKGIGGRPSKYNPKFCEVVEQIGSEGGWLSEMAEACDVHRSTIDSWCEKYPEFRESLSRAKQKSQAYFEKLGREALFLDKFNSSLWIRQMAARFRDEYSERSQVDHTSSDNSMTPREIIIKAAK